MALPFLTARWSNLFLATYAVPSSCLESLLVPGLALDTRDGQAFVSLVAFDFLDTRVLGIPWPGYRNFPEVNLRFYVRHGERRGVVFVRELIPKRFVAWVARVVYNEPYVATPMTSLVREEADRITIEHRLQWAGQWHTITATGSKPPFRPEAVSTEHFFKEHEWGFGASRKGRLQRYQVRHAEWDVYPILSHRVDLDFAQVYGPQWAFLNGAAPASTVLAQGSTVAVYPLRGTV